MQKFFLKIKKASTQRHDGLLIGIALILVIAALLFYQPFSGQTSILEERQIGEEHIEEDRTISLAGNTNNAFFENNNLIMRNPSKTSLDLDEGTYKFLIDISSVRLN